MDAARVFDWNDLRGKAEARDTDNPARWEYGQRGTVEVHQASPRRRARRDFRKKRPRRWTAYAWIGPETVAALRGARPGYVWQGQFVEGVDWDMVEVVVQYLLGYSTQVHGHNQPILRDAFQSVALAWPPMEFREAVEEVVWRWSCDVRIDRADVRLKASRRLLRARRILEAWNEGREVWAGERAAS